VNPAVLLLAALRSPDLETRFAEAFPWVAWHNRGLDWTWLLDGIKVADLKNRLGFVVSLAKQVASSTGDHAAVSTLAAVEQRLERSRLVREDTLCREGMLRPSDDGWARLVRPRRRTGISSATCARRGCRMPSELQEPWRRFSKISMRT
jgi:hypothetical protein